MYKHDTHYFSVLLYLSFKASLIYDPEIATQEFYVRCSNCKWIGLLSDYQVQRINYYFYKEFTYLFIFRHTLSKAIAQLFFFLCQV